MVDLDLVGGCGGLWTSEKNHRRKKKKCFDTWMSEINNNFIQVA